MKELKVLAVDDEFLALQLLKTFISKVPDLNLVGATKSPLEAMELLQAQPLDILFLDIQMPTINGLNMLKTLQHQPIVIFTTAYSEYAVKAFELNAVDYLLKPFPFERFLQAVNKAKQQLAHNALTEKTIIKTPVSEEKKYLAIKCDAKIIKLNLSDILCIEGLREYVKFICKEGNYVSLMSLKNLEADLPPQHFIRVHKSYIVNSNKVKSVEGNLLYINDLKIPISRDKKAMVIATIFGAKR